MDSSIGRKIRRFSQGRRVIGVYYCTTTEVEARTLVKRNVKIFQTTKTPKCRRFKMAHDACEKFLATLMLQFLGRLSFPATRRNSFVVNLRATCLERSRQGWNQNDPRAPLSVSRKRRATAVGGFCTKKNRSAWTR